MKQLVSIKVADNGDLYTYMSGYLYTIRSETSKGIELVASDVKKALERIAEEKDHD